MSFEFDRWISGTGVRPADRLDVLAVDRTGRLIVAELKRDRAPDTITMQAINYAAMVNQFSLDTLAEVHAAHLGGVSVDEALTELRGWAEEISDESLTPPRILLIASDFGPTVTNTAMFLYGAGLDLRLIRYQLYKTAAGQHVLSVTQLLPVPDAEEFMVRPRSSSATQAATRVSRQRRASVPQRLVSAGVIAAGAELSIVVPDLVGEDRESVREWLAEDPERSRVTWRQDGKLPVEWVVDNQPYYLTSLIRHIIEEATGQPPRTDVWGPNWYRDHTGQVLHRIAEPLP